MTTVTAIDGHVHIHAGADAEALLNAALYNVETLLGEAATPCLLLTETARDDAFGQLHAGRTRIPGWTVARLRDDPACLVATRGVRRLYLVAGYQVVTAERIEVLALATRDRPPDGLSLPATLAALHQAGTPAVLPWGLGKWLGHRGSLLASVLDGAEGRILLGDNKGRPNGWPTPGLFDHPNVPAVLPGTDPLPVPGAETTVCSFGFVLEGGLDAECPSADLSRRLTGLRVQPETFGTRCSPLAALRAQLALRRSKRHGAAA